MAHLASLSKSHHDEISEGLPKRRFIFQPGRGHVSFREGKFYQRDLRSILYPILEDYFPFSQVGYVHFLEGISADSYITQNGGFLALQTASVPLMFKEKHTQRHIYLQPTLSLLFGRVYWYRPLNKRQMGSRYILYIIYICIYIYQINK